MFQKSLCLSIGEAKLSQILLMAVPRPHWLAGDSGASACVSTPLEPMAQAHPVRKAHFLLTK